MNKGISNLVPFKKGDPRINRNGRKKSIPGLDRVLTEVLGADVGKKSRVQEIVEKLAQMAIKGDVRAAELLLNRCYGKVTDRIQLNADVTSDGKPVNQIDWTKISDDTLREVVAAIAK